MHSFERQIGAMAGLPAEVRERAIAGMEEARQEEFARWQARSKRRKDLNESYLRDLRGLIGESNWPRYQRLHDRRVREMRKLGDRLDRSAEGVSKLKEKAQKNVRAGLKLIQRSGLDEREIRKLRKKYHDDAAALYAESLPPSEAETGEAAEQTRGDWVEFGPPYQISETETLVYSEDPSQEPMARARCSLSGNMAHESRAGSDGDEPLVLMYTRVAHVVQISPGGNTVKARAWFETGQSDHATSARDPGCGYHGALVGQVLRAWIGLRPLWPTGGTVWRGSWVDRLEPLILDVRWPEGCDGFYERIWRPGLAVRTDDLTFPGSYPDNQYVLLVLSLGTANDLPIVTDMNVQSYLYETFKALNISLQIG